MEKGQIINIAATILHLILFFIIALIPSNQDDPKGFLQDQKQIASQRNTSVFLLKVQNISFQDACSYWPYEGFTYGIKVNLKSATIAFTAITCIAHFFYCVFYPRLKSNFIDKGTNIFRWIEYGLSAPIMLCILAILANVRDQMLLLVLFILTSVQMIQGYYVENALSTGHTSQSLIPFFVGVLCLIVSWIVIFQSWYDGLNQATSNADKCSQKPYTNSVKPVPNPLNPVPNISPDSSDIKQETPSSPPEIANLIWIIFFLFASFGIVNFVQIVRAFNISTEQNNKEFIFYEYAYITLSFISKTVLILWCVFSIFLGKLEWLKTCPSSDAKINEDNNLPFCLRKLPFLLNDN